MTTQVRLNVSSSGSVLDAEAARALVTTLATKLAEVASDAGNTAVADAALAARGTLSMSNNKQASTLSTLPIARPGEMHAEAEIVAVPRGAWYLVEYGGKPHKIRGGR